MLVVTGQGVGCPDTYWFAYAADPPVERQRRGLWSQQVDELASPEQELDGARSSQKESPGSPLGMSFILGTGATAQPASPSGFPAFSSCKE